MKVNTGIQLLEMGSNVTIKYDLLALTCKDRVAKTSFARSFISGPICLSSFIIRSDHFPA